MTFTVAIIGRPNVGKSTLFNRLVGKRLALVDDTPGVTRDRREGQGRLGHFQFTVIDTAGLEEGRGEELSARMRHQTEMALKEANFALFMIDARAGVTPLDKHFAAWLRKEKIPVILLANKAEGKAGEHGLYESYALGFGDPVPFSAEHGEGISSLFDAFDDMLLNLGIDPDADEQPQLDTKSITIEAEAEPEQDSGDDVETVDDNTPALPLQLAIVGRPNAGKSTLINQLLGEDRQITGPEAGLTRDSIAVPYQYKGREIRMFDTAGMRRKSKVVSKLEKLSVADTIRALNFAEVVVLMIDALDPLEKQDLTIASLVIQEGRGLVIAVNKIDLVEDRQATLNEIDYKLERTLPQVKGIPIIPMSALSGKGVDKLMPAVLKTYDLWNMRISTSKMNRWLSETLEYHALPTVKGRRLKLRYITQVKTRPPTFTVFMNRPSELPKSYKRYLVNELRRDFDLPGIPIRLLLRKGDNPYD
ncbi:MAG: ribosome biogenesis GTPase Der [Kordiimonas sp.]|nr:ribosome biogenesis GTPase Der [Kordiimonas sp.]